MAARAKVAQNPTRDRERDPSPEQRGTRGPRPGVAAAGHYRFDIRAFDLAVDLVLSRIALERIEVAHPVPEMAGTIFWNLDQRLSGRLEALKDVNELRALGPDALVQMRRRLIDAWLSAAEDFLDAFRDEERERFLRAEIPRLRRRFRLEFPGRGSKFLNGLIARELHFKSGEAGIRTFTKNAADPARRSKRRIGLDVVEPRALRTAPATKPPN